MEMLWIMLIYPLLIIAASVIGYMLFEKWYVVPVLTIVVFTIFMFTLFNESFFIWVVIYTIISLITSFIMQFIKK